MLLHATALVDVANKSTNPATDLIIDSIGDRHVGGTSFSIIISEDENYNGEATLLPEFRWTSRHKKDHPLCSPPSEAITTKGVSISGVTLHCFTEHKCKGFKFRAHADYQHKGPWHDWVYYQYTQMGGQILGKPGVTAKTTFLYSNDKKHVCQSIKFLKEALTNEYKHIFENFTNAHWVL